MKYLYTISLFILLLTAPSGLIAEESDPAKDEKNVKWTIVPAGTG